MKRIFDFIIKIRHILLIMWGVLIIGAAVVIPMVKINYDSTKYLPNDTRIKESLRIMEEEFGLQGQASIMIEEVSISEAIQYKSQLKTIQGVADILWLDSFVDPAILTAIGGDVGIDDFDFGIIPGLNQFYKNESALFQLIFTESDHALSVGTAIEEIRDYLELIGKPFAMSGTAISTYYMRVLTTSEVLKITLVVMPIILIILIVFTSSWAEPVLFILVVGAGVLVNMGTNIFFPSISFLTNSTAMLLQLAISMDYSIFLLHQYTKQRDSGLDRKPAIIKAMQKSFLSINASMFTTIAGFVALMFMRYTIGFDLSAVMVKGILISLVCTFTLMPALIVYADKLLTRTKHKPIFPQLDKLVKYILKFKYVLPSLALLILIPVYQTQNMNKFIYGDAAMGVSDNSKPAQEKHRIEKTFGRSNMIVLLVPYDEDSPNGQQDEINMVNDLKRDLVRFKGNIQSLASMTDLIPKVSDFDMLKDLIDYDSLPDAVKDIIDNYFTEDWLSQQIPEDLKKQLVSENYSRIIISVDTESESEEAFAAVRLIESRAAQYFLGKYHILGLSSSVKEIQRVVETDFVLINILSIGLVLIILMLSFRSILIPIILVLIIELSIWINMSIPFLTGAPLIFIGYMIVSAIQLGATIDYGILLTHNYLDARKTMYKAEAVKYSVTQSGHSILTSALILGTAGFTLKLISSVAGVSSMGELIGRGAFLSGFLVLFMLPQVLYIFDKWIAKTTFKSNFIKQPTAQELANLELVKITQRIVKEELENNSNFEVDDV